MLACTSSKKEQQKASVAENTSLSPYIEQGRDYFNTHCRSCHREDKTGMNKLKRMEPEDAEAFRWLYRYLQDSEALIQSGDPESNAIKDEYNNNSYMHQFKISEEDLLLLIAYIQRPELIEEDK